MVAALPSFRDSRSLVLDQPEIVSSQELQVEEKNPTAVNYRQKRAITDSHSAAVKVDAGVNATEGVEATLARGFAGTAAVNATDGITVN